ncbi:MAG: hypothetical protein ACW98Y_18295 [Candidatus Thorarchaeota archaeon]
MHANIEAILIIKRDSGIPLMLQKMNPRAMDMDPGLVSGFLYAIQSFSSEVVEKGADEFQIDYGKKLFTIFSGVTTFFVTITLGDWNKSYTPTIRELIQEFEKDWYIETDLHEESVYQGFRRILVERIGLQGLSEEWIPYFKRDIGPALDLLPVETLIDGSNTIRDILSKTEGEPNEALSHIARLWGASIISFKNLLDDCDIIIPTQQLFRYIQSNTDERKELERFSGTLVKLLPQVVKLFDGRATVEEVLANRPKEFYHLLDFLLQNQAIEVLSPEKKRILLVKELLEQTLQIADSIYSPTNTLIALRTSLEHVDVPEIIADIHVEQKSWNIDYGFLVYDGLTPNRIMEIHGIWISILMKLVKLLPSKNRKKFVTALVEALNEGIFDRYASDELDGVDDFTFNLEAELR